MKIKCLFVLCFWFLCDFASAQAPDWNWACGTFELNKYIKKENYVSTSGDGYVYLTGSFNAQNFILGSTMLSSPGYPTVFVAKYDSLGNLIWAKSIAGYSDSIFAGVGTLGISVDKSDNCYITGYFEQMTILFGSDSLADVNNQFNFFVAKYDSAGNAKWIRGASDTLWSGGGDAVEGDAISVDNSGNVIVEGQYYSHTVAFGANTIVNNNWVDSSNISNTFIVKYDSLGNVLWAENAWEFSNSGANTSGLCTDDENNIYLAGLFYGDSIHFNGITIIDSTPYLQFNYPYYDTIWDEGFIAKYNDQGNLQWTKGLAGLSPLCITSYPTGNGTGASLYTVGNFLDTDYVFRSDTIYNRYQNMFVGNLDSLGNFKWIDNTGGYSGVAPAGICADNSGNVYVTGATTSYPDSFGDMLLNGVRLGFIAKYDTLGNASWVQSATGNSWGTSLCVDQSQNVYISGGFLGPELTFGSITVNSNYTDQGFFVAQLGSKTIKSGIPTYTFSGIMVYPNPSNGDFHFSGINSDNVIEIYDLLGQLMNSSMASGNNYMINLSDRSKGIYFYRILNASGVIQGGKIVLY